MIDPFLSIIIIRWDHVLGAVDGMAKTVTGGFWENIVVFVRDEVGCLWPPNKSAVLVKEMVATLGLFICSDALVVKARGKQDIFKMQTSIN